MAKITIFTGAGVSKESGIETFRDGKDAYWNKYSINDVATRDGWEKDLKGAFKFYHVMKEKLPSFQPNDMHKAIAKLEEQHEVTIVTQNVDDLHERAGSSNVIHLHGELLKKNSTGNPNITYDNPIGEELEPGMESPDGFYFRPNVVLFGEMPFNIQMATSAIAESDIIIIIGTSFQISYTVNLVFGTKQITNVMYIDPKPMQLSKYGIDETLIHYNRKTAVKSIDDMLNYIDGLSHN